MNETTTSHMLDSNHRWFSANLSGNEINDFVELIEKSIVSFGEDLASGCLDESDVEKLLLDQTEIYNHKIFHLFLLMLTLFSISIVLSTCTLMIICWQHCKLRRGSAKIRNSFGESSDVFFRQHSDREPYRDNGTFSPEIGSFSGSSFPPKNKNPCYPVAV